jgi:flagellar hook-associated protein 2
MTGINSGLDTDSIIQELMSAYNAKTEKYEKEQTKISWKQEIWEDLNTKVNSFYKSVGNLKYSSGYSLYKASSSDSTKASVSISGSSTATGTQKLHVLATAQSAYLTGTKITTTSGGTVSSDTTMASLGFASTGTLRLSTKDEDGNDTTTDIRIESTNTVSEVVDKLRDAGINASFDSSNGRFFLSSKSSGEAGNFDLTGVNTKGSELLSALGLSTSEPKVGAKIQTVSGTSVTSISPLADLGLTDKIDYSNPDSTTGLYTSSEQHAYIKVTGKKADGSAIDEEIKLSKTDTISDVVTKLQDLGLDASFNSTDGKITVRSLSNEDFSITAVEDSSDPDQTELNKKILSNLGLESSQMTAGEKAVKLNGSDASIVLNGVVYTGSSNSFTINGMTITANGTTDDIETLKTDGVLDLKKVETLTDNTAININVSVDAQGIYDTMKDFLTQYNSIINELTKLYNADSASDYEPLTDDEKSEMTDTEISKWETKIKDSLLRRDTTLSTLMSVMKNAMAQTYTVNGKKYALSSFGISTLYYGTAPTNEESAYHIDGDEDDENVSGNTDKLLAAINDDPDTVVSFMKQLATSLYSAIDNQMTSTTLRSRYSIYNDKELQDQYDNYTTIIDEWEDKVSDKEDYYYDKFASMETALGTLNSQTSALSGLLGS